MDRKRGYLIYLRKSRGRAGIARQRTTTRRLVENQLGGYVAGEYVDTDATAYQRVGGARPVRDDFALMLERLRAGQPQERGELPLGVASWHSDRVARSTRDSDDLIEVCAKGGHPLETVQGGGYNLGTASGRKNFTKDVVDAAFEVDHLIERVVEAKDEAAAEGRWLGGMPPFPYEGIPGEPGDTRQYTGIRPVPAEAKQLQEAARAALSGTSLYGIVRDWTRQGLLTRAGQPWTPQTLRRTLTAPRNAGLMTHRGVEAGPASWEPVLSIEVFRALQSMFDGRKRPGTGARKWQGSGLYLCGRCGKTVLSGFANTRSRGRPQADNRSYKCSPSNHLTRRCKYVDDYVSEIVCAFLAQPDIAAQWIQTPDREDVSALQARVMNLRGRMDELAEQFGAGNIDTRQLGAGTAAARQEITGIEAHIAAAARLSPLVGLVGLPKDQLRAVWDDLHVSRRQAVIRRLFTVTIKPAGKGRPSWAGGQGTWFDTDLIDIDWHDPAEQDNGGAPVGTVTAL